MLLAVNMPNRHAFRHVRLMQQARQIKPFRLPMRDGVVRFQHVHAPDHFVERAEPKLRHDFAAFLRDVRKQVDDVFRFAAEIFPQFRLLRRNAYQAGVEMAFPQHDAAERHERNRRKSEFVRAKHGRNRHVAPGFQLPVGLQADAPAQIVQHENLLRFRNAKLHRQPGVFNRRHRRRARAALAAANQNAVRFALRHACRDDADADFRDELDADVRPIIGVFQVINQLRQILNRVNVMMRRRRNQDDARHGAPRFGDFPRDFAPRQLPAFARFRALRHLDLNLIRVH